MCECDDVIVHQVETEVKKIFQHHYGLEQWAGWIDEITTHLLQEHIGSPDFARAARQLILKWTFYRLVLSFRNQLFPLFISQGSHTSWKVLDFFPKVSRTWKVLEIKV